MQQGGFTERLHTARTRHRARASDQSDQSDQSDFCESPPPACPRCGKPMRQRTARKGSRAGHSFWGCSAYPDCTGTRPFTQSNSSDQPQA